MEVALSAHDHDVATLCFAKDPVVRRAHIFDRGTAHALAHATVMKLGEEREDVPAGVGQTSLVAPVLDAVAPSDTGSGRVIEGSSRIPRPTNWASKRRAHSIPSVAAASP